MRQRSIGAIGSGASIRFHHRQAYAWTVVSLVGLLTGCVETAPVITKAFGESKTLFRSPLLQSAVSTSYRIPLESGWLFSAREEVAPDLHSEPYWRAVADLDLSASRSAARSEAEIGFAEAIALLSAGYLEKAESAFVALSSQAGDFKVAVAAQILLARTLLYERKWLALRDLRGNSSREIGDRGHTAESEQWGQAFAGVEQQATQLPNKPVLLPLKLTRLGTPAVKVRINGKEYEFWLDTGSSITVLSSEVASDAKVPIVSDDTLMVRTLAGTALVRPALIRRMELGTIVFTNTSAIVIDASLMRLKTPGEGIPQSDLYVDGIIGWDTIRQLDVLMDYESGTLALSQPENLGTSGTAAQNLSWVGKPLIEVRTKTGKTFHFTLDTGAQSSFVSASILERAGAIARISDARVYGIASTGTTVNRVVPSLTLMVAGKPLQLQRMMVYSPSSGLINCDGILGSDIAGFGRIRIDATNGVFSVGD